MKTLRLALIVALALCAFAVPTTPSRADDYDCPYDCYNHDDCYEICECLGYTTWWYCARNYQPAYPGSCYCL